MLLIVLGALVFIATLFLSNLDAIRKFLPTLRVIGIVLAILGFLTSCFKQIDAGFVGVKVLFGKVQTDILESGLHVINPLLEIKSLDVRTQNYTMSGVHDEGDQVGDDAIRILTADGLEVTIDLTVLFKVVPSDAPKILNETGLDYNTKIIRPITRTAIRDNAVYYDAVALYSSRRDEFQNRIYKTIESVSKKSTQIDRAGIDVTSLNINQDNKDF